MNASELLSRYAAGERNFGNVDLRGVNLNNVNLSGVNLNEANFSGASLQGINLGSAILSRATFRGAKLSDAETGVNFTGAVLPNGKPYDSTQDSDRWSQGIS